MTKIIVLISLILFGNFVQINSCANKDVSANNSTKTVSVSGKVLTISELNKQKPEKGTFEIKGFVAKIYTCPPCPPDAQCKPCMKNNIVVSEENKNSDSYDLTDKEIIIFTNKTESFAAGKQYQFTINITDTKTTSANLNDIELIDSNEIKNQ